MKVFIGIATASRNMIIEDVLRNINLQTEKPNNIIVCTPEGEEYNISQRLSAVLIEQITAVKGSCAQRNAILDRLSNEEGILLIIDDDFVLHHRYVEMLKLLAKLYPDVALFNGKILKDGIIGPGITVPEAESIIDNHKVNLFINPTIEDKNSAYGCNMAIRLEKTHNIRFDEKLPLYGWQEDVDYSSRLSSFGRIVQTDVASGVHLGIKIGRTSGVRFGYSQVMNPFYLVRKRTMRIGHAFKIVLSNLLMNFTRSIYPESYIDRRGRLKGNLLAAKDIIFGYCDPLRVLYVN